MVVLSGDVRDHGRSSSKASTQLRVLRGLGVPEQSCTLMTQPGPASPNREVQRKVMPLMTLLKRSCIHCLGWQFDNIVTLPSDCNDRLVIQQRCSWALGVFPAYGYLSATHAPSYFKFLLLLDTSRGIFLKGCLPLLSCLETGPPLGNI